MPISRSRRPRNRSQRARRQLAGDARKQFNATAWRTLQQGAAAEATGDAERALELHLSGPHVPGSLREHMLREVVLLADEAPPWVHSRWVTRQAYRWMLMDGPDELDRAVLTTLDIGYADVDPVRPLGKEPSTFLADLAAADWVCSQLALFEYGGLADFLQRKAHPRLRRRADRIDDWVVARLGGYRLTDLFDDRLEVTDLATGGLVEVLNLGSCWGRSCGAFVIGRLVPISGAPGRIFESRPVDVDEETARRVAETSAEPMAWTGVISEARQGGRLAPAFSVGQPTSLLCDLPGGAPVGLVDEPSNGAGDEVAAVRLCDFVLDTVRDDEGMAAGLAPPIVAMLLEPDLRRALTERCVDPSRERAWLALAAAVHPPFRARCHELAALSGNHLPAA